MTHQRRVFLENGITKLADQAHLQGKYGYTIKVWIRANFEVNQQEFLVSAR
jgi:hypothetical protein